MLAQKPFLSLGDISVCFDTNSELKKNSFFLREDFKRWILW